MIVHYHSLQQKGELLPSLWQAFMADDTPPWLWGYAPPPTLTEFVIGFSAMERHLFVVLTPEGTDFVGALWIDEISWGHRARAHFYFFPRYRNQRVLRVAVACQRVLRVLANPPFNLRTLLFFISHEAEDAQRMATKFGVTFVGDIPDYYPDGHVARIGYRSLEQNKNLNLTPNVRSEESNRV